jgi:hypothetical protein
MKIPLMKNIREDRSQEMLSLSAESLVCQSAVQMYNNYDTQNYNFACCLEGCEALSLTLRKEHRLRLYENWVVRKLFRAKTDAVTRKLGRLYNEEL